MCQVMESEVNRRKEDETFLFFVILLFLQCSDSVRLSGMTREQSSATTAYLLPAWAPDLA